jgi:hypothetical protein
MDLTKEAVPLLRFLPVFCHKYSHIFRFNAVNAQNRINVYIVSPKQNSFFVQIATCKSNPDIV